MIWKKQGLIYTVNGQYSWNKTHAQCPVVDIVNERVWRIYYATRNTKGQSQISYIEVEAGKPEHLLYEHDSYLFDFGQPGTFDDSGLMPSCVVSHGGKKYLYYIGWTLKQTVPYHNSIGLAVSDDGGKTFKKMFEGSILPSIANEPYFTGTSCVLVEGGLWRMWYLSCIGWALEYGKMEPKYHIKYAESRDGISWERHGKVAIELQETEYGIASASVIKEHTLYKMWYSYRKGADYRTAIQDSYRIGYAESRDGIEWLRKDGEVDLDLSASSWDDIMQAYPNVVKHKERYFMFYNGNGFGRSGIGYAIF